MNMYLSNTPNKCTYIVFNNLKFTLKHLKRSYMFRSYDHPREHMLSEVCYLNKLQNSRCNDEEVHVYLLML